MEDVLCKKANYYGLDYLIYSDGRIIGPERGEIKQRINPDGYAEVTLGTMDNRHAGVRVHRIIAEQFVENPNHLPEVNHKDYNRLNNDYTNLEWISHIDNVHYSSDAGRYKLHAGETNGRALLSWDEVCQIRYEYSLGFRISYICKKYNKPYSTTFNIVHNKTWAKKS